MRGFSFEEVVMASAYISPRFAAIDAFGNPLVGGRLYTYANTTTTPQATYQDAAGTIANTNPIILDARGEAVVFLTEGLLYTFVLKDASDALIWSQDNVASSGQSGTIPSYPNVPGTDVGSPVYVAPIGWMNWDGTRYVSDYEKGFDSGSYSSRNRIINGCFRVWQRGTSVGPMTAASVATFPYSADRWKVGLGGTATVTVAQIAASADYGQGRVGAFSARITSNAAATVAAGDKNRFAQLIEGQDLLNFALGSLWGGTMTLSFWVKASIAGTYSVAFLNSGSPGFRSYATTFAVAIAGTPEFKQVQIPMDQSGVANWNRTDGVGLQVVFDLGSGSSSEGATDIWQSTETTRAVGSVRLVSTNAATLELSNVQLEYGAKATPFESRPTAIEQSLCDRYFKALGTASFRGDTTAAGRQFGGPIPFSQMRVAPTVIFGPVAFSNAANAALSTVSVNTLNVYASAVAAGGSVVTFTSMTLNSEL
jgi:hypothetical protein